MWTTLRLPRTRPPWIKDELNVPTESEDSYSVRCFICFWQKLQLIEMTSWMTVMESTWNGIRDKCVAANRWLFIGRVDCRINLNSLSCTHLQLKCLCSRWLRKHTMARTTFIGFDATHSPCVHVSVDGRCDLRALLIDRAHGNEQSANYFSIDAR